MTILDKLIGQRNACKGDAPHSRRCKRCRRGRTTSNPIRTKKEQ